MKKLILISLALILVNCSGIDDIVGQTDNYICVIEHTYTNSDNESETDFECYSVESESFCDELGAEQGYSVEKYDNDEDCEKYCEDVQNCSDMG